MAKANQNITLALRAHFDSLALEGVKFNDWRKGLTEAEKAAIVGASTVTEATVETAIGAVETAQAAVAETAAVVVATATVSKASLAREIFNAALAEQNKTGVAMVRKDILARFIAEAGLTKNGAQTYYNNFRDKAGLVVHKAA